MEDNEKEFEEVERKIDVSETQSDGSGGGENAEPKNMPETEEKPKEEPVEENKVDEPQDKDNKEQEESGDGEGDEKDLVGELCVIIGHGIGKITSKKGDIYIVKSYLDNLNRPVERFGLAIKGDKIIYQKKPSGDLQNAEILLVNQSRDLVEIKYVNEFGVTKTDIEPEEIRKLIEEEKPSEGKSGEEKDPLIGEICGVFRDGAYKGKVCEIVGKNDFGDYILRTINDSGIIHTLARMWFAVVGDCVEFNSEEHERIVKISRTESTFDTDSRNGYSFVFIVALSDKCDPIEEPKPEEESTVKIFSSNSIKFCRFITEQVFKGFNVLDKFGNKPFLNDVIYSFLISTFSYRYSTLNWGEAVDIYNEIWMYDEHKFETKNPNENSEYDRIVEIDNILFEELVNIVPQISDALDDQYQADFIYNAMQVFTGGMPFAFIHNAGEELFTVARIDEDSRFIVSSKEHPTKLNYLYRNGILLNWVFVEREFLKMDEVASLIRKMCKQRSKYIIGTTLGNAKMLFRIKDVVEQFAKTI